eukprot:3261862-Amphidinium_carterae.1
MGAQQSNARKIEEMRNNCKHARNSMMRLMRLWRTVENNGVLFTGLVGTFGGCSLSAVLAKTFVAPHVALQEMFKGVRLAQSCALGSAEVGVIGCLMPGLPALRTEQGLQHQCS